MAAATTVVLQRLDYLLDLCDQSLSNCKNVSNSRPILSLGRLSADTQSFLESYTKESIFKIIKKCKYFRDEALDASDYRKYRCFKHNMFMRPVMVKHPLFKSDIEPRLLSSSKSVLDIGCCFGTDLRYALHCGCDRNQILGVDINEKFIELGFDFYSDRNILKDRFIAMDVLEQNGKLFIERALKLNDEQPFDIIFLGNIYHLLTEEECKQLTQLVFKLINPKNGVVFGTCIGSKTAGLYERRGKKKRYLHSKSSLRELFESCGNPKSVIVETNVKSVQSMNRYRKVEGSLTVLSFCCKM